MKKRIIPILLVVLLFTQCIVWASDVDINALVDQHMTNLVDMDRVFKYDYMRYQTSVEEEITAENLQNHNAAHAMMALGLMNPLDDGTFGENEAVPLKTFAQIIMKLTTGSISEMEEGYEWYPDNRYTTYNEAAYYLVGALGYDVYESKYKGENPRSQVAHQIGLTNGLSFVGEKNITRGELAKMLLTALQMDMVVQTVYGGEEEFEKVIDHTLLKEKFNAAIIYGTVTAQNGLNLYTESPLKADTISIDRAVYNLNGYAVEDVLGYRVQAVVQESDISGYDVLGLTIDERDKTLVLPLGESIYTSGQYLYYTQDGKEKKQNLSSLERIMVNDEAVSASALPGLISNSEGEIRLSETVNGGGYTLAVVRKWSTFVVKTASVLDEKIYLDYNATFKSNNYIDVDDNKNVYIKKNGMTVALGDIVSGSVIDVIENKAGNDSTIMVSDSKVSGTVTQTEGNAVVIDGKRYLISKAYIDARVQKPSLPTIKVGGSGTFLLNVGGQIVDYISEGDSYTLGLLKEYGRLGSGLNSKVGVRVFTEDNEWKELELADKITMDGIQGVTSLDAYAKMESGKANIILAPMRFGLNADGRVQFLDTALVNDVERNDSESIIKAATYSGKTNWTSNSKAEWSGLTDSKYFYTQATTFITIPRDPSKEEEYTISNTSYLTAEMYVNMDLYNVDDFFGVGLVVRSGSSTNVTPFKSNYSWIVFTGLTDTVNEDGEAVKTIHGFDGSNAKFIQNSYTLNDADLITLAQTFSPGDLIHISADGKDMLEMEVWCEVENLGTDIGDDPSTEAMEGLGTVLDVDPARKVVKVNVNGQETTWRLHCLGLFDRTLNKGQIITAGDIRPGDRVFGIGGFNYMRTLIIR